MHAEDLNKIYALMQKCRLLHAQASRRIINAEMAHLPHYELEKAHAIVAGARRAIEDRVFAQILNAQGQTPVFDELKAWAKTNYPWLNETNLENFISRCTRHF